MAERKYYLVIGANGAVGAATVELLRNAGHIVSVTGRSQVPDAGGGEAFTLDMADAEGARATLDGFFARQPAVDGVIVCSGTAQAGPLELAPLATVRHMLEVNTLAVLAVYQAALPALRRSQGVLAIVGSISGIMPVPFLGGYSTSKSALEGLADVMRREAYPWGVHVGIVEPGTIRTPMTLSQLGATREALAALSPEHHALYADFFASFLERVENRLPDAMPPEEVAAATIRLLTERLARLPVGADAVQSAQTARTDDDSSIDAQFRTAFGPSLARI